MYVHMILLYAGVPKVEHNCLIERRNYKGIILFLETNETERMWKKSAIMYM